jgi:hypothetical protein
LTEEELARADEAAEIQTVLAVFSRFSWPADGQTARRLLLPRKRRVLRVTPARHPELRNATCKTHRQAVCGKIARTV